MASRFLSPFGGRGLIGRDPFLDLHREVNRLFDDSLRSMKEGGGDMVLSPKVDICQTEEGWEIAAELPGVNQEDIDIRLDGDILTIGGEKRDERRDDKRRFVERSYGSFTRSFQLPFAPDPDMVTADCDRGVLTIKLPKGAERERSRRISVGSSGNRTIDAESGGEPAIGKDWMAKQPEENADSAAPKEEAEQSDVRPS